MKALTLIPEPFPNPNSNLTPHYPIQKIQKQKNMVKQGRIYGYPSRVRVGRGSDEINQLGSWAGAVTPNPPVNAKKTKCCWRDRRTDRQSGL